MSSDITVRQATITDTEIVAEYNRRLALETENLALDTNVLLAGVRAALSDENRALYFVAEAHGQVVGQIMITYEWSDWRNGVVWWIQSVYVAAEWRKRGVFRQLYSTVLKEGQRRGAVGFRLYVVKENDPALQTYQRLGMKPSPYIVLEHFPHKEG